VGNITSDFIKGKKQYDYPEDIRTGILLHRAIDAFTDEHRVTKEAMKIFRPHYRLYSAPFTDIVYDHFLANDSNVFTENTLADFARETYRTLDNYMTVFPGVFQQVFPYMKKYDWLFNYRHLTGIEKSFEGIAHRAKYMTESQTAFLLFKNNYEMLQQYYNEFFPSLKQFAWSTLQSLHNRKF
jgi:acyl carrier protein phosphodiesterase